MVLAGLQLASGQVDSRVLLALADLAGQHPISIVQFGDDGPGASADIPRINVVNSGYTVDLVHDRPPINRIARIDHVRFRHNRTKAMIVRPGMTSVG